MLKNLWKKTLTKDIRFHDRLIDNPYLENSTDEDFLFHLGISNKKTNLPQLFGDVKFVCMCGKSQKIKNFATILRQEVYPSLADEELVDLIKSAQCYSMYKVGNVLCFNHGIGFASVAVILHEVIKLLHYAGVKDPEFFRIGTCEGVNIPEGTVIISEKIVNEFFKEQCEFIMLGKRVRFPALLDQDLVQVLKDISSTIYPTIPILSGKTMSVKHFYESVASTKASICINDDDERQKFLNKMKKRKVLAVDMEAIVMASMTHYLGIKAAAIYVTVNNITQTRKEISNDILEEWESRPFQIVMDYIKSNV